MNGGQRPRRDDGERAECAGSLDDVLGNTCFLIIRIAFAVYGHAARRGGGGIAIGDLGCADAGDQCAHEGEALEGEERIDDSKAESRARLNHAMEGDIFHFYHYRFTQ